MISSLCIPNLEFQLINPTTQVSLFALCPGNCSTGRNITWKIYHGVMNTSGHNHTHWTLFNQMNLYQNIWFFGKPSSLSLSTVFISSSFEGANTRNFTASNRLFLANSQISLWRFEVVYSFPSETSSSALNFVINQPPSNGSCSISPSNGTTTTLFRVSCPGWFDQDEIKDYSLFTASAEPSQRLLIAFSSDSTFDVQLSAGQQPNSSVQLLVSIRDTRSCVTEWSLPSIFVRPDSKATSDLLNALQSSSHALTTNPLVRILATENQNTVGQVITSLSQQFNQMNTDNLQNASSNGGIPVASISVSSLGAVRSSSSGVIVVLILSLCIRVGGFE